MRLFATGAINWVMGKALPDDVPLEAKMVSKAIERAQTTVEQKNGEIRKNVLKYDEVMNAQRKVIYALRDQILDEADLREKILGEHLPEAVEALVGTYCVADYHEEWDIDGLHSDVLTYWPSSLTKEQLSGVKSTDDLYELLVDDATTHYEKRESDLGADVMRQVERQVMLKIIDTKWREHLYEMDYLQEGINLRAMGQKDPLTEWQREGYEMFGLMMKGIAQDLVKYVMHVQVNVQAPAAAPAVGTDFTAPGGNGSTEPSVGGDEPRVQNMQYSAPDDPAGGGMAAAARRVAAEAGPEAAAPAVAAPAGHHDPGGEVRLGQDAPQRPVPLRQRQEVQALPRQGLTSVDAGLHRRARAHAQAHRRRVRLPQDRGAARPTAPPRDGGVAARPLGRSRYRQARHRGAQRGHRRRRSLRAPGAGARRRRDAPRAGARGGRREPGGGDRGRPRIPGHRAARARAPLDVLR